jgi:hypothetical protein
LASFGGSCAVVLVVRRSRVAAQVARKVFIYAPMC